jgi:hypothetical protein
MKMSMHSRLFQGIISMKVIDLVVATSGIKAGLVDGKNEGCIVLSEGKSEIPTSLLGSGSPNP